MQCNNFNQEPETQSLNFHIFEDTGQKTGRSCLSNTMIAGRVEQADDILEVKLPTLRGNAHLF